jgi:hypothetical protein
MLYIPNGARMDKLLIRVGGNGAFYEYGFNDYAAEANDLGVPMLCFNPRDVGESTGSTSPEGLALDVFTAYEYGIQAMGINPNDVLVHGMSLGGASGAMGARLIQEKYPDAEINIVNNRSFGNLPTTAQHLLGNGRLAKIAKFLLEWTGWEMNAKEALENLRGRKLVIRAPSDGVIHQEASMARALENTTADRVESYELRDSWGDQHNRDFSIFESTAIYSAMRSFLALPPKVSGWDLEPDVAL